MALSKVASDFAREIRNHDWSDAPYRLDRAGHDRATDTRAGERVLTAEETDAVRTNVMWVTAQVLGHQDPNLDVYEFAEACGINTLTRHGQRDGSIEAGVRKEHDRYARPGTWEFDLVFITTATSDFYHRTVDCGQFKNGYRGAEVLTFPVDDGVPPKWKPCVYCVAVDRT
ncbi:hypothetical protein [Streptomyces hokutonensis]|uniref:hypothetical protein n=1 Tax=Streptomyces hokutonensis TaxID=1306990 RepID=UPI0003703AD1|nr:hypothetical protein [Streptomyces hokutonensis]